MKKIKIPEFWNFNERKVEDIFSDLENEWEQIKDWDAAYTISKFITETGGKAHKQAKWLNIKLDIINSNQLKEFTPDEIERFAETLQLDSSDCFEWKERELEIELFNFKNASSEFIEIIEDVKRIIDESEELENEIKNYLNKEIEKINSQNKEDFRFEKLNSKKDFYFSELENGEHAIPEGFIYILSNPLIDGIHKVSFTVRNPDFRASQLSSVSGLPLPFKIEGYWRVDYPKKLLDKIYKEINYCVFAEDFYKENLHTLIEKITSILKKNTL